MAAALLAGCGGGPMAATSTPIGTRPPPESTPTPTPTPTPAASPQPHAGEADGGDERPIRVDVAVRVTRSRIVASESAVSAVLPLRFRVRATRRPPGRPA